MKLTEKELRAKLDLVVDKLLNLDRPTDEKKIN